VPSHQTISIRSEPSPGAFRSALVRLLDGIRSYTLGPLTLKDPELARKLGWNGGPTASGVSVNEGNALTYAAVWRAVSLISSQAASLPLILYKRLPNGGKERFTSHQTYRLLHDEPNPEMSSMVMRETMTAHCLTWGNCFAEIERDVLGRPIALWPLLPNMVRPYRDQAKRLFYSASAPGVPDVDIPAADMIHVHGLGFDGLLGYSVIHMARESLGLGLAAQKFGATFFGNGSTFGGVLQHPKTLVGTARENIIKSVEARHAGVERAHRFLILEEGMTYQKLGIAPNDAQFLETRQFEITEVARWFGVPPHKLHDLTRATFSNIESENIQFVVDCLQLWLIRWEQELNRKLISRSERNIQFVEHLVEGLLRGDSAARGAFYREMFNIGAVSIDEIRERENLNPIGAANGGDVHWVPLNMAPSDLAMQPKPEPAPPAPPQDGPLTNGRAGELIMAMRETQTGWERLTQAVMAQDQQLTLVATRIAGEQTARAALMAQLETVHGAMRQAIEAELATRDQAARELTEVQTQMQAVRDRWAAERAELETALKAGRTELASLEAAHQARVAELESASKAERERIEAERQASEQAIREALTQDLATARQDAATRAAAAVAEAEQRRDELHAALEAARTEHAQADTARVSLEAALAEQRSMTAAQIAAWAEQQGAATSRVAQAEARIAELIAAVESVTAKHETAIAAENTRRQALEAELADVQAQAEANRVEAERWLGEEAQRALEAAAADTEARVQAERAEAEAIRAALEVSVAEARAQAEAKTASLQAQLAQMERHLAEQRAAAEAEATRAAAIEARAQAERDASVVNLQQAARRAEEEAAARADAEAHANVVRQAEADRVGSVMAAHRALVVDRMQYVIEREADRARRAQATPEKLRNWMDSFYAGHEDLCINAFLPVIRVHLAWMGTGEEAIAVTRELARRHVEQSRAQLRSVLSEDPEEFTRALNALLHRWEHDRAQELADQLLQREIDYARRIA
jgi:HK97 family phage portal protein